MDKSKWYYAEGGKPIGPLDLVDIQSRIKEGFLNGDDLIWKQGTENWITVRNYEALQLITPEPTTETTPQSQVYPTKQPLQQESTYRETATNYPENTAVPHEADPYNRVPQYEDPYPDNKPKRKPFAFIFIALAFCASLVVLYFIINHNIEKENQSSLYGDTELDRLESINEQAHDFLLEFEQNPTDIASMADELVSNHFKNQEEHAKSLSGDKRIITDVENELRRLLFQTGGDENTLITKFTEAGGIDPATLTRLYTFIHRRKLFENIIVKKDIRDEFIYSLRKRFSDGLNERGIKSPLLEQYTDEFVKSIQLDYLIQLRSVRKELISSIGAVLDLLFDNHDKWTLNNTGTIQFNDSANDLAYEYARLVTAIDKADIDTKVLFKLMMADSAKRFKELRNGE